MIEGRKQGRKEGSEPIPRFSQIIGHNMDEEDEVDERDEIEMRNKDRKRRGEQRKAEEGKGRESQHKKKHERTISCHVMSNKGDCDT
jgi:hypothetical protein